MNMPLGYALLRDRRVPIRTKLIALGIGAATVGTFGVSTNGPRTSESICVEPTASGYSAFERPELTELLRSRGIDEVTVVGLATDFCVAQTAEGALQAGLNVTIERAAIRGIDQEGSERALAALLTRGAQIH